MPEPVESTRALLDGGADPNIVMDASGTPLIVEVSRLGYFECVRRMLEKGANPNAADAKGRTPLMQAVYYNRIDSVKLLLERGADVNAKFNGKNALDYALQGKHSEIARLLKQPGTKR